MRSRSRGRSLQVCVVVFQVSKMPKELLKATALLRRGLTTEPHEWRVADAKVLSVLASVSRRWCKTIATSCKSSRRELKQLIYG